MISQDEDEEIFDFEDLPNVNTRSTMFVKFQKSFPTIFAQAFEFLNQVRFEESIPDAKVLRITKAIRNKEFKSLEFS